MPLTSDYVPDDGRRTAACTTYLSVPLFSSLHADMRGADERRSGDSEGIRAASAALPVLSSEGCSTSPPGNDCVGEGVRLHGQPCLPGAAPLPMQLPSVGLLDAVDTLDLAGCVAALFAASTAAQPTAGVAVAGDPLTAGARAGDTLAASDALCKAAKTEGAARICQLLLIAGADINYKNRHDWTPLQLACSNGVCPLRCPWSGVACDVGF